MQLQLQGGGGILRLNSLIAVPTSKPNFTGDTSVMLRTFMSQLTILTQILCFNKSITEPHLFGAALILGYYHF
jgi:hypothetical protein